MGKKTHNRNQAYSKKKVKIPISNNFGGDPDRRSRGVPFVRNTVSSFLFYILIFLLPTQLGKHFFFDFSYVSGVRVDYLAPTVYLTDLLAFGLILFNWQRVFSFFRQKKIVLFLCLLLINIMFSRSKPIALYTLIKLIEMMTVYVIFKKSLLKPLYLLWAFLAGGLVELTLSLTQFITKHSIQGIFYFLGERYLSLSTPGVAKTAFSGVEFLRPYGTFSHPNSMAGFYLLIYFFVLTNKKFWSYRPIKNALLLVATLLILISFSKVAIGVFVLLNLAYLWQHRSSFSCRLCFFSRLTTLVATGLVFLSAANDPLTIKKRMELVSQWVSLISYYWLTGVGMGSYVSVADIGKNFSLDTLNQPVHNIFLLALAELGIPLSIATILLWKNWLIDFIRSNILIVLAIILTGIFDHYWLTLQQNQLLLGTVLGFL